MQAFLGRLVGAKVLQHVIDGIFKTGPGLVRSFHAFRHKLANFKSVHPLRQGAVYLIGYNELQHKAVVAAWGAELVRSVGTAGAEQAGLYPDAGQSSLYAGKCSGTAA